MNPGIFSDLQNLEKLDLYNNELVELDKDLFKNLTALKKLLLNNNKITKYEWFFLLSYNFLIKNLKYFL